MAEMNMDLDNLPDEMLTFMGISREDFAEVRKLMKMRDATTPDVGTEAPDFEIERLDANGRRTEEMFHLGETRGKPVGLIFGSYT